MAAPSPLFDQYETQYCTASTELSLKIEGLAALPQGASVKQPTDADPPLAQQSPLSPPCLPDRADQKRSSTRELEAAVRDAEQIVS